MRPLQAILPRVFLANLARQRVAKGRRRWPAIGAAARPQFAPRSRRVAARCWGWGRCCRL